jgi:hypothetical protein
MMISKDNVTVRINYFEWIFFSLFNIRIIIVFKHYEVNWIVWKMNYKNIEQIWICIKRKWEHFK